VATTRLLAGYGGSHAARVAGAGSVPACSFQHAAAARAPYRATAKQPATSRRTSAIARTRPSSGDSPGTTADPLPPPLLRCDGPPPPNAAGASVAMPPAPMAAVRRLWCYKRGLRLLQRQVGVPTVPLLSSFAARCVHSTAAAAASSCVTRGMRLPETSIDQAAGSHEDGAGGLVLGFLYISFT